MKQMLKKVCAAGVILASLTGCAQSETSDAPNVHKVSIIKQLDHSSMNEIAEAIEEELKSFGDVEVSITNGQNDTSTLQQVVSDELSKHAEILIPIGTLATQVALASSEDTPIVYASVCDPKRADILGSGRITGTSDALDVSRVFELMQSQEKPIKKLGLLYSLSEINAQTPIQEMKEECEKHGVEFIESCGNTSDEVMAALGYLVEENVDAVFTPIDNVIMANAGGVAQVLNENKIPFYTGADSFVTSGALATCGINYVNLGKLTADLAHDVLVNGIENQEEVVVVPSDVITVNQETADNLGVDVKSFEALGNLRLVTTEVE